MRPSEITAADLAVFARYCVDAEEYEKLARNEQSQVALALNAAKGYVRGYRDIKVEALGGMLTLKKLPLSQVLTMLDDQDENAGMKENLDFEVELIYKSCPMLQNKELQEAYGCQEPYDIVLRVLDDNVGALAELANAVLDFYGMGDSIRDQLKN